MGKVKKEYLLAIVAVIIWGTISPVGKLILNEVPEMQLLFITACASTAALWAATVKLGHVQAARSMCAKDFVILAALGFLGTFLYNTFYYYGISQLTSQEATIINYLWPMMIVLFSWPILHEKLTGRSVVALIISFAGIAIMVTKLDLSTIKSSSISGVLSCFVGAVTYGAYSVINKRFHYDQYISMTIYNLVMAICSGAVLLVRPQFVPINSPKMIIGLLWTGIVINGLAYLLWNQALIQGDTSRISNIAYLTPFLSILFAKLLLNEPMSVFSFIGLGFIIAGIAIQFWGAKAKSKSGG